MARTLKPVAGASPTLSWLHNDPADLPQSAYHIQIIDLAAAAVIVDTGFVASSASTYAVPGGLLALGASYKWQVETKNSTGYISQHVVVRDDGTTYLQTFSDPSYFRTVTPPTVVITGPGAGPLTTPTPTVSWTYDGSTVQTYYEVSIRNYTTGGSAYTSGTTPGSALALDVPIDYLTTGYSYAITVRAYDADGIAGDATVVTSISYSLPATPASSTVAADDTRGVVDISFIGAGTRFRAYRRVHGDTDYAVVGETTATNPFYVADLSAAAGEVYDYGLTAVDASNRESVKTEFLSIAPAFAGTWFISPDDRALDTFIPNYSPPSRSDAIDQTIVNPLDRNTTVIETGAIRTRAGKFSALLPYDTLQGAVTATTKIRALKTMRNNGAAVWMKGSNPESTMWVRLLNVTDQDFQLRGIAGDRGYSIEIDFHEVEGP